MQSGACCVRPHTVMQSGACCVRPHTVMQSGACCVRLHTVMHVVLEFIRLRQKGWKFIIIKLFSHYSFCSSTTITIVTTDTFLSLLPTTHNYYIILCVC